MIAKPPLVNTTFGNSPASLYLYKVVENDGKIRRKISSKLSEFSKRISHIEDIKDPRTKSLLRKLIYIHFKDLVMSWTCNPVVKTLTLNVLKHRIACHPIKTF